MSSATWPQKDIPPPENLQQASIKEHWDYSTGATAGRTLTNSPPERLHRNAVRTVDNPKVASSKENRKKNKSKKPKNAENPTEPHDTETNEIEAKRDGVRNTGEKSRSDFNAGQDRQYDVTDGVDDVTGEDSHSNVCVENNPR